MQTQIKTPATMCMMLGLTACAVVLPVAALGHERPDIVWMLGSGSYVRSVGFSPDGQTLASAHDDQTVKLWRVLDGQLLRTLTGHTDVVNSVAFSPDGKMLASGSADHTVRLWQVSDGALLRTLTGHADRVSSVAFAPDGETLASAGRTAGPSFLGDIKLWRVSNGHLLRTLAEPYPCNLHTNRGSAYDSSEEARRCRRAPAVWEISVQDATAKQGRRVR